MKFEEVLPALREGKIVKRGEYNNMVYFTYQPVELVIRDVELHCGEDVENLGKKLMERCSKWNTWSECKLQLEDLLCDTWEVVE